jgi:hypothetical protein
VAVTRERLLIRPQFPFNLFAAGFDLEHEVPLRDVEILEARGGRIRLRLPGRTFTLRLWKSEVFLETIRSARG